VIRLKVPPKTKIGVHIRPADENVTILSGTLYFAPGDKFDTKAAKAFGPGSYFSIGKGKPMFAYTTDKEAVAQLHGNGPWGITYLDSADARKEEIRRRLNRGNSVRACGRAQLSAPRREWRETREGGLAMPLYLTRFSYTPETWARLMKNPEDRRDAARKYIESVGGKLHGFWYAFGAYDGYNLWEAPDNVSMATVAIAIGGGGALSKIETTPLLTVEETLDALGRARAVAYRPPGA
jgi:uncharacterized protein with GYD domain